MSLKIISPFLKQIRVNQSAVPVMVTSSTRFGCYSTDNGMIPLFTRFLNGMKFATISSTEDGPFTLNEKYGFTELTTPVYFDIIVCTENGKNVFVNSLMENA